MQLLIDKLQTIKNLQGRYDEITENWNMGLLTSEEYDAENDFVRERINEIKKHIKTEYNINDNAVNLLLILNIR